jgi:hypothetical protein|tara:strand:+ start:8108 stop:8563 length:456 start_codon:yes stop_codon:yes gene_type:complete
MSRWANLKYGLVLILITLTPFSFYGLFWGIKSLSWVPLEAQIVKVSRIERSGSNLPVPEIRVVYQYIINGKKYLGDRVAFLPKYQSKTRSFHISYADKYKNGQLITVFFDFDDPENVVIEKGISVKTILLLVVQFLLILFILFIQKRKLDE